MLVQLPFELLLCHRRVGAAASWCGMQKQANQLLSGFAVKSGIVRGLVPRLFLCGA